MSNMLMRRLGALPDPALELCAAARPSTVHRGQSLLRAGEHWQHLWWVESGALRLYYIDRDGAESNKNFFLDDALFWPITSTLRDQPVGFYVDALEDSTVWAVPIAFVRLGFVFTLYPGVVAELYLFLLMLLSDNKSKDCEYAVTNPK